jgi:hypothetical protein
MQLHKKYRLAFKFLQGIYTYEFTECDRRTENGLKLYQGKNLGKHKKQVLYFTEPQLMKLGAKIELT